MMSILTPTPMPALAPVESEALLVSEELAVGEYVVVFERLFVFETRPLGVLGGVSVEDSVLESVDADANVVVRMGADAGENRERSEDAQATLMYQSAAMNGVDMLMFSDGLSTTTVGVLINSSQP